MRWLGREPHSFGTPQSQIGKSGRWGRICPAKLSFSNLKILISASGQELLEHPSQVDSNEDSQFCCLSGLPAQKKHHCRHASRRVVRHAVGGVLGLKSTSPATLFAPCLLQVQFRRQPIHDKPTSSSSKNAAHITK